MKIRTDRTVIALLLALLGFAYTDILFLGRGFYVSDLGVYHYPMKHVVRRWRWRTTSTSRRSRIPTTFAQHSKARFSARKKAFCPPPRRAHKCTPSADPRLNAVGDGCYAGYADALKLRLVAFAQGRHRRASRRDASIGLLPVHPGRSEHDRIAGVAGAGLHARDPLQHVRDVGVSLHALKRFVIRLGGRTFQYGIYKLAHLSPARAAIVVPDEINRAR
jgi:hypothetical protein